MNVTFSKRLTRAVNRSGHNGKVKTLKAHVVFSDGSHWQKGAKILIRGVNYLYAKVQLCGKGNFASARIAHSSINW